MQAIERIVGSSGASGELVGDVAGTVCLIKRILEGGFLSSCVRLNFASCCVVQSIAVLGGQLVGSGELRGTCKLLLEGGLWVD